MSALFDICSDLHIDTFTERHNAGIASVDFSVLKNPDSDILVVAGDTANNFKISKKLLNKAAKFYKYVLFIDGNHEHYTWQSRRSININENYMKEFSERHQNIVYLSTRDFCIGDTAFVGLCGWYDWQIMCPMISRVDQYAAWLDSRAGSNDRFIITDIQMDVRAMTHANRLVERVKKLNADDTIKHIVVVTHTAPLLDLLDNKPWDMGWQKISGSYANSQMVKVLEASGKINTWIYGHTHERKLSRHHGVSFVNNARGYSFDADRSANAWFMVQMDSAG